MKRWLEHAFGTRTATKQGVQRRWSSGKDKEEALKSGPRSEDSSSCDRPWQVDWSKTLSLHDRDLPLYLCIFLSFHLSVQITINFE